MATKPLFEKVLQIAMVVEDCDEAVKKWADDYGIGPWKIYEFNPANRQ
jgi:methylmalonyl-CoA/ethylmalonyl-CoA epimerase